MQHYSPFVTNADLARIRSLWQESMALVRVLWQITAAAIDRPDVYARRLAVCERAAQRARRRDEWLHRAEGTERVPDEGRFFAYDREQEGLFILFLDGSLLGWASTIPAAMQVFAQVEAEIRLRTAVETADQDAERAAVSFG